MEKKILLEQSTGNNVSRLRGKVISYLKLHLLEKTSLSACILRFYNDLADQADEAAWLKLVKPGFTTSQVLVPDQDSCFLVMDYDYCEITDLYGVPLQEGKYLLVLNEITC